MSDAPIDPFAQPPPLVAIDANASIKRETMVHPDASSQELPKTHIRISVRNPHGDATHFQLRRTSPLQKLFDAFFHANKIDPASHCFLFEG